MDILNRFEQMLCQAFENVQDIFLGNEGHLAVYLCKFGLAVGTQVLIPKTFYDLEIAVEPAYHEQLLKGLRRLRQSVKLTRIHAAWHYEIPCAFRRRFYQNRGF